jgi:hypothetical protein
LVKRIFEELIHLELEIFVWIFMQEMFGIYVHHGLNVEGAVGAEGDIFGVAQDKSPGSDVFAYGVVQEFRELADGEVGGGEAGLFDVNNVTVEKFLASLCELDNFDEQFSNVIRY